jgi:hypothetical protein
MNQPVFQRGNPAQIVNDVLLADLPDGDILAGAVAQRRAKELFAQEVPSEWCLRARCRRSGMCALDSSNHWWMGK